MRCTARVLRGSRLELRGLSWVLALAVSCSSSGPQGGGTPEDTAGDTLDASDGSANDDGGDTVPDGSTGTDAGTDADAAGSTDADGGGGTDAPSDSDASADASTDTPGDPGGDAGEEGEADAVMESDSSMDAGDADAAMESDSPTDTGDAAEAGDADAAPAPPAISNVSAPSSVTVGAPLTLTFDYSASADVAWLEVTRTSPVRSIRRRLSAGRIGISGTSGSASLSIDTWRLPFGASSYTFHLIDATGLAGDDATFSATIGALHAPGTAPVLSAPAAESDTWRQPAGPDDRIVPAFTFHFEDPDADLANIRLTLAAPDGASQSIELPAEELGAVGTSGDVSVRPFFLDGADPLGDYTVTALPFDWSATAGTPVTWTLTLSAAAGLHGPTVSGLGATTPAPGETLSILGLGFDDGTGAPPSVALAGRGLSIAAWSDAEIDVVIPEDAQPAPLEVVNARGRGLSAPLSLPTAITVLAGADAVPVGGELQMRAAVTGASGITVSWRVEGVPGGDASVGTIDPDGLYHAPSSLPAGGAVSIEAALVGDEALLGALEVAVVPPQPEPGFGRVLAAQGGTVPAPGGLGRVTIPAGALAADTDIAMAVVAAPDLPAPPPGRHLLGAVVLEPDGLSFASPVEVDVPLRRYTDPGTVLALREYLPDDGSYAPGSVPAVVDASGVLAVAQLDHFSEHVADEAAGPCLGGLQPTIDSLAPTTLDEGVTAPFHLLGDQLLPELDVTVLRDGVATSEVQPGPLYAVGTEAGLTLRAGVLADLAQGETRDYVLRLTSACGATAEIGFSVGGLDELVVGSGETLPVSTALTGRYSAIDIESEATVAVGAAGALDLTATDHVRVDGHIDARGTAGANASGRTGAPAGARGGAGGNGRREVARYPLPEGYTDDSFGHAGLLPTGLPDALHARGGIPGSDLDAALDDIVKAILDAIEFIAEVFTCVTTLDPYSCVRAVGDLVVLIVSVVGAVEAIELQSNDDAVFHGQGGGGGLTGSGGGGGGGGGVDDGIFDTDDGGGGGGGGEPGRDVTLVSGGFVSVSGQIDTTGGAGGNGARWEEGFVGGGGGAGGAGRITVMAGQPLAITGLLRHGPAAGGRPGCMHTGDDEGPCTFYRRSEGTIGDSPPVLRGAPGALGSPVLDPATLRDMVSPLQTIDVRVSAADGAVSVRVEGEVAGPDCDAAGCAPSCGSCTFALDDHGGGLHTGQVAFFPGFNRVVALADGVPPLPPVLDREVLLLARDRDGDGLVDTAEEALGTDENNPDSDGDGLLDGQEVSLGFDPTEADADGDGLDDPGELAAGTDPRVRDTDLDGIDDGAEILLVSDPTACTSFPYVLPDHTIYVAWNGEVGVLDPTTGQVGLLSIPEGGPQPLGLAFVDATPTLSADTLYLATADRVALLDPLDGQPASSADLTGCAVFTLLQGGAGNPSGASLIGVGSSASQPTGQIVYFSPSSGACASLGSPYPEPLRALARDPSGAFYAVAAREGASDALLVLDCLGCSTGVEVGPIEDPSPGCTPETCPTTVTGIAFGGGDLYAVATDGMASTLMQVDPATAETTWVSDIEGAVTSLAIGPAQPPAPTTCDIDGTLYAAGDPDPVRACYGCDPVRSTSDFVVTGGPGCVSTVAGSTSTFGWLDGPAHQATLTVVTSLALDEPNHRLYFIDSNPSFSEGAKIRYLDLETHWVHTLVGPKSGIAPVEGCLNSSDRRQPQFYVPDSLALTAGPDPMLYVADAGNNLIRGIHLPCATDGVFTAAGGQGECPGPGEICDANGCDGDALTEATLPRLRRLAVHETADGPVVYITDQHTLRRFSGGVVDTLFACPTFACGAGLGLADAPPDSEPTLMWTSDGTSSLNEIDLGVPTLTRLNADVTETCLDGPVGEASLYIPFNVHYRDGLVYVADSHEYAVRVYSPETGDMETLVGTCGVAGSLDGPVADALLSGPLDVAIDAHGGVYIAETRVIRYYEPPAP